MQIINYFNHNFAIVNKSMPQSSMRKLLSICDIEHGDISETLLEALGQLAAMLLRNTF